jgi:cytochrome c-type biogenesis protein CcmE
MAGLGRVTSGREPPRDMSMQASAHPAWARACALALCAACLLSLSACWVPVRRQAEALPSTVSEVMRDSRMVGQTVSLEGRVLPGSWNGSRQGAFFQIGDADWTAGRGLGVRFSHVVPEAFGEEAFVLVKGTLGRDMVVDATEVRMDPSLPRTRMLHVGDHAQVRGLEVTLAAVEPTSPAGMAPGLVTAPLPPSPGHRALFTLVRVRNSTEVTQPCVWDSKASLLDGAGGEYRIIGAAFHATLGDDPERSRSEDAGFEDPLARDSDRSAGAPKSLGPGGEAYILTVFDVPRGVSDVRLQWNPGGTPVEFWVQ